MLNEALVRARVDLWRRVIAGQAPWPRCRPNHRYSRRRGTPARRPLDALAVRGRGARRLLLPALRSSDGRGGRESARRAGRRRGAPLLVGHGRGDQRRARPARARGHDRGRRGLLLRHAHDVRRLRAVGPEARRVRPDGTAAGRRPARLARGALEPVPDDARLRGRRGACRSGARRRHCRDARPPAPARARRGPRPAQRDEVPRRPLGRPARRRRLP